jgi:hypothetical protein
MKLLIRNVRVLGACLLVLSCVGQLFAQGKVHQVEMIPRTNDATLFSQGGTDHYLGGDAPNEFGTGRITFRIRCQPGSRNLAITVGSSAGNSSLPEKAFEDVSYRGSSTEYALDLLVRTNSKETKPVSIILGNDGRFTFHIDDTYFDVSSNVLIGFKGFETVGYNLTFKRPEALQFLEACGLGAAEMRNAKAKTNGDRITSFERAVEPDPGLENTRAPRDQLLAASLGFGPIHAGSFFEVLDFGLRFNGSQEDADSSFILKQLTESPGAKFVWRNSKQTLNYVVRSRDGRNVGLLLGNLCVGL